MEPCRGARAAGAIAVLASAAACSHDWAPFDPRGADASGAATGAGGAPGSGATGSSGGGATGTTSTTASTSTSGVGGAGGDGGDGSGGGPGGRGGGPLGGAGGGGGPVGVTTSYVAVVADCIAPAMPDPDECALVTGSSGFTVDLFDDTVMLERDGFVRFDLDGSLAGKTIDSVELVVTATNAADASGPTSGEVWEVAPFTRPDLFVTAPAKVGAAAVAGDQGAVVQDAVITFPIPVGLVTPSSSVFLGIFPISASGVDYDNLTGQSPPVLVVHHD